MSRIFLSHSSADNAEAIAIRDWMIAHGWDDLFLDLDPERGLKAGERWQKELKRAAEHCEMVVFLISPAWVGSPWCRTEFLLAQTLNKRIFAVIVEPTQFSDLPTEIRVEWLRRGCRPALSPSHVVMELGAELSLPLTLPDVLVDGEFNYAVAKSVRQWRTRMMKDA
jgi:hypothetical protein